jgi:hypothetical protein
MEMSVRFEDALNGAILLLETAKRLITSEIGDYPTPVSGGDAQYNHLLSKRSQVSNALVALRRDVFVPTPRTLSEGSGVESR